MWKRQEESTTKPVSSPFAANPPRTYSTEQSSEMERAPQASVVHLGKSLEIKGELKASEDLHIEGKVEGAIQLRGHSLTVGTSGKVRANVNARSVLILGSIEGNICAAERVDIRRSGSLIGDLVVAGVSIEDGAYFRGTIDIRPADAAENKRTQKKADSTSQGDRFVPAPPANHAVIERPN